MKYLPLIWAALCRRKLSSILTLLSITVAFTLFGTMMGLDASFQRLTDLMSKDGLATWSRFGDSLNEGMGHQIERLPAVAAITPVATVFGYHQIPKLNAYVTMVDPDASKVSYSFPLTASQWSALTKEPNGVYISRQLAAKWSQKPGSDFTIISPIARADGRKVWHFKVLDVLPDIPFYSTGFSVGNYTYFEKSRPLADQPKTPFFQMLVKDSASADATADAIDTMFSNSPIPTLSQADVSGQQTQAEGAVNVASLTARVSAVGLFMILLLTGHGLAQSVRERLTEFATLKTLGFSDRGVMALVVAEALLPCLFGAALGLCIAATFAGELPKLVPGLGLPIPYLSPLVIIEAFAAASLVALIGSALPVRRLRRLDVAAVLSGH